MGIGKIIRWIGSLLTTIIAILLVVALLGIQSDRPVKELEEKYFTTESSYLQVKDSKLHVRIRGNGTPVLLLHGSFSSLHTWDGWEKKLSLQFKTISVDFPGHGLTGPNPSHTYSTDDYERLIMALADTLRLDTFYVAGNSMGGNVAWKMALHNPGRVRKLILVDAAGVGFTSDANTTLKRPAPFIFTLLRSPLIGKIMTRVTPYFLFKLNMRQVYGKADRIQPGTTERLFDLCLREGNRVATMERLQQPGRDLHDSLRFIQVPTLVMWGAKDKWIPVENAYQFEQLIPGAHLKIFPDAGHVPMEEIPDETVQSAIEFLRQ